MFQIIFDIILYYIIKYVCKSIIGKIFFFIISQIYVFVYLKWNLCIYKFLFMQDKLYFNLLINYTRDLKYINARKKLNFKSYFWKCIIGNIH